MAAFRYESLSAFPKADLVITEEQVLEGLDRLATGLQPIVTQHECVLLGVMNGGLFPLMHLANRLQGDFLLEYCHASRYQGALSGGELHWLRQPSELLQGRTVIVIDDIWDEGTTLQAVAEHCKEAGAVTVLTAVLFVKDRERPAGIPAPDFHAELHVPDRYVFGCGMDVNNHWRQVPAVYALQELPSELGST